MCCNSWLKKQEVNELVVKFKWGLCWMERYVEFINFFFFFGFSCLPTLAILNGFQQGIQFEKVVFFAVC